MKLQRMEMQDFRLYRGIQEVSFAADPHKNVTVIYGANGGGKTTLLNAFLWVLFGVFSDDVQQQSQIINDDTWASTPVGNFAEARVTLQFENDGMDYVLTRSVKCNKEGVDAPQDPQAPIVNLAFTDRSGKNKQVGNPEEAIDQILPRRLKDFFFFNGERIENLVRPDAYQEIEAAIKTLLGLEVFERASLRHLPDARKKLAAELSKVGDTQVNKLVADETRLGEQLAMAQEEKELLDRNVKAMEGDVDAIDRELENLAATKELQLRRSSLEREHIASLRRESEARESRDKIVNDLGFLAFIPDLMKKVALTSASLREKGQIPTPLKRQFVDDLLEKGVCICGTSLVDGELAHSHVAEWRVTAGIQEVEESWTTLAAGVRRCVEEREELAEKLDRLQLQIAEEVSDRSRTAEELSDVTTRLIGSDSQNVLDLETKRIRLKDDIRRATLKVGAKNGEISSLESQIKDIQNQLRKANATSEKAKVAKDRVAAVEDVLAAMKTILELRTQAVRSELNQRIKSTYESIAIKNYEPELTEDFTLELWQGAEGANRSRVPMSTGENQILSLSFVGALAATARDKSDQQGNSDSMLDTLGGVFPVVMDAAFGSLDNNYRRDVASALPKLAPQIIVLVSKAQGEGPVAEELADHVGATYVMTVHTKLDDAKAEKIQLGEKAFDYVVSGADGNYTELVNVGGN